AEGCLLVVGADDGSPVTGAAGLTAERVDALVASLLRGAELGDGAVAVPVAADGLPLGHLVLLGAGQMRARSSVDVEPVNLSELLTRYAPHAATATRIADAWGARGRDEHRLRALLTMSQDLANAVGPTAVAEIITTALPEIVGCRASSVML